jgi:hypothetical protein
LSSARRKTAAYARRASPIRCSLPGSGRSFQQKPHRHRKKRSNHNGDNPSLPGERRTFLSLSAIHRPRDACPVPGGPFLPPRGHDRPCVGPAASSSICIDLWSAQSADRAHSIPCAAVPLRAQWAVAPFRGPAETRWSRMQGPAFLPQRPPLFDRPTCLERLSCDHHGPPPLLPLPITPGHLHSERSTCASELRILVLIETAFGA